MSSLKEKFDKIDKRKLLTRIIASVMLVLMVFSVCGTLVYYVFVG